MKLNEYLNKKFLIFDGAMGTMLQEAGLKSGEFPETYNITNPDIIYNIHKKYIEAGADIITTNTFGANKYKMAHVNYSVDEIIKKAVGIAKRAAGDKLVALDIGPIGKLLKPSGTIEFNEAYDLFKEQVIAGRDAGADIVLIETISDLYEAKAAILAAKENCNLPVICTMTYQSDGRTLTGTDPLTMVNVLQGLGVDALGVNCSMGPLEMTNIIDEITRYSNVPIIVQPNAGLPRMENKEVVYDITRYEFAKAIEDMAEKGVSIFGGCCGTDPGFIVEVRKALKGKTPRELENKKLTCVSSGTKTIVLDNNITLIGERINPTGKEELENALRTENITPILDEAINQKKAGADILDVNIGLPDIDEEKMMVKVVKEIQAICDLPLQIDSVDTKAIEASVREYNGKPIINSVNGKKEIMDVVFPIVKKYGACVIGLTLDERGLPSTVEERIKIAEKIITKAQEYGIPKENILIDCLVLTSSTHQDEAIKTLQAQQIIKTKYGVKTVLGISNISYGLPNRQFLNRTYLTMALTFGLDAAIADPLDEGVLENIKSFSVLSGMDKNAKDYISYCTKSGSLKKRSKNSNLQSLNEKENLVSAIIDGLHNKVTLYTKELLNNKQPMDIIDNFIIPALDIVSERYENNEVFLPQLMQSAESVKMAFDIIKKRMKREGNISKGKILLATVTGDIHDIGKKIVRIILENYGYDIVDLGVDVDYKDIITTIKRENIKLLGLSALMTTTVTSMEKIIEEVKANCSNCKIMVGGAVLNQAYASEIRADYYAKDARDAVRIAKEVFNT